MAPQAPSDSPTRSGAEGATKGHAHSIKIPYPIGNLGFYMCLNPYYSSRRYKSFFNWRISIEKEEFKKEIIRRKT
jgi:hypothetical protein